MAEQIKKVKRVFHCHICGKEVGRKARKMYSNRDSKSDAKVHCLEHLGHC